MSLSTARYLSIAGVVVTTLLSIAGCNFSDDLRFVAPTCERDSDCNNNGECILARDVLLCQCDPFFDGPNCGECVPGRVMDADGRCVEEISPDMGEDPMPCMELAPGEIDFNAVDVGRTATLTATINNCSDALDLDVDLVEICSAGGACMGSDVFEIAMTEPPIPATIAPGESAAVQLRFAPNAPGTANGRLEVSAGSLGTSIDLTGVGTAGPCPEAVIEGKPSIDAVWRDTLSVPVATTVNLRGSMSMAASGAIAGYEWSIVQRPMGSTAMLSATNTETVDLLIDSAGDYVVELHVLDEADTRSCDAAQFAISGTSQGGIFVQLLWDTPTDGDQTDATGTDIDLHFLHPNGVWNSAPWDIYWQNITADWGAAGPAGDPQFERDDDDGVGPESFRLLEPEDAILYSVAAYYYADRGFGASYATAQVYIDDALAYESADMFLQSTGTFWFVATISWPSGNVRADNTVRQGFP